MRVVARLVRVVPLVVLPAVPLVTTLSAFVATPGPPLAVKDEDTARLPAALRTWTAVGLHTAFGDFSDAEGEERAAVAQRAHVTCASWLPDL